MVVARTGCYDPAIGTNTLSFSVSAVRGGILPSGSVLRFGYSGGNSWASWSGTLADHSTVSEVKNGAAVAASAYGTVTFRTTADLPSGAAWSVTFGYKIGPAAKTDMATLAIVSGVPSQYNVDATNDSASYTIGSGSCNK